jgi:hypothetical protein
MAHCINIIKTTKEAKLTGNDLRSTALAALMLVYHQALQVRQETGKVRVSMIPEETLATQQHCKCHRLDTIRTDL